MKLGAANYFSFHTGIGYFTLPYLVHAGTSMVHACEWNPDAVDALKKNLVLNNVQGRCQVHAGDNKQVNIVVFVLPFTHCCVMRIVHMYQTRDSLT